MSAVEKFPILLSEAEEESPAVPPCFSHEGVNVCSTTRSILCAHVDPSGPPYCLLICVRICMELTPIDLPNHSTFIFATATCTFSL
jgi:hypothetical protein